MTRSGDGISGVPPSTDILSVAAVVVGLGSFVLLLINLYQRDWTGVAGPAATTVGMVCVIVARHRRRRAARPSAQPPAS